MSDRFGEHSSVGTLLGAIGDWVTRYRQAIGLKRELANCGAEEVAAMARDIGLSAQELEFIASKGPNAAAELPSPCARLALIAKTATRSPHHSA